MRPCRKGPLSHLTWQHCTLLMADRGSTFSESLGSQEPRVNWEHCEEKTLEREERRRRVGMALVLGMALVALRCHDSGSIYIDWAVEFGRNKHVQ